MYTKAPAADDLSYPPAICIAMVVAMAYMLKFKLGHVSTHACRIAPCSMFDGYKILMSHCASVVAQFARRLMSFASYVSCFGLARKSAASKRLSSCARRKSCFIVSQRS
eukprot:jgi/Ulvmu1/10284/UM060_0086.1